MRAAHVQPVQLKPQRLVFRDLTLEQPGAGSLLIEIDDEPLLATRLTLSD